jgi:hypothetical protein
MKFALLDNDGVVIQTQPHIQPQEINLGFIVVEDDVVPGMIKQEDGSFKEPEPDVLE